MCYQIPILTEEQFIAKINDSKLKAAPIQSVTAKASPLAAKTASEDRMVSTIKKGLPAATPSSASKSSSSSLPSSSSTVKKVVSTVEDRLWVDKYKPQHVDQLIGSNDVAKKLMDWVRRWDDVHLRKSVKIPHSNVCDIV